MSKTEFESLRVGDRVEYGGIVASVKSIEYDTRPGKWSGDQYIAGRRSAWSVQFDNGGNMRITDRAVLDARIIRGNV